jgi:ketosteroid isomerase-like protein
MQLKPGSDLAQVIEQDHRASDAFHKGDPEPKKRLFSRRDDATLANPLGLTARGWSEVEKTMEYAASRYRDGEPIRFERISEYATADLAYMVELERSRTKVGGADEMAQVSLRVTTIFRREDGTWKIVHRHADPLAAPSPSGSTLSDGAMSMNTSNPEGGG